MRLLAIDTALGACSAAVLDTARGAVDGGILASESVPMIRGHAEALMPIIERVMKQSAVTFDDLDRIVATTGPGSFTGLRVGLAAARGFGVAMSIPVLGVSTLSAYAAPYLGADEKSPVVVAIDARHNHVYLQVFGPGGRTVVPPRLAPLGDAVRAAAQTPAVIVGSAARSVADALRDTAPVPLTIEQSDAPDIVWVAQMGSIAAEAKSPPKPQYLRAADAQPQNAAQLPRR